MLTTDQIHWDVTNFEVKKNTHLFHVGENATKLDAQRAQITLDLARLAEHIHLFGAENTRAPR